MKNQVTTQLISVTVARVLLFGTLSITWATETELAPRITEEATSPSPSEDTPQATDELLPFEGDSPVSTTEPKKGLGEDMPTLMQISSDKAAFGMDRSFKLDRLAKDNPTAVGDMCMITQQVAWRRR